MSDAATPPATGIDPASQLEPSEPPPAWQPPAREWQWRDLFSAPMLAFKPKCMAISALTMLAIGLWLTCFYEPLGDGQSLDQYFLNGSDVKWLHHLVAWLWWAVALAIGGVGATLVSTFIKADLLDDEFLSWAEAMERFRPRLVPALLVPVFLLALATAFWVLLLLCSLLASIPYVGTFFYAVLYPLLFGLGLLAVLVSIAAFLGLFLAPGIVATRSHGWFDNVVDAVEAVGTKPHLLLAGLVLTGAMTWVATTIADTGLNAAYVVSRGLPNAGNSQAQSQNQVTSTEDVSRIRRTEWLKPVDPHKWAKWAFDPAMGVFFASRIEYVESANTFMQHQAYADISNRPSWVRWGPGLAVAIWQVLISALIMGYGLNLVLSGGLLTYLWVREDDYWDEEDLQDLDQLAAELEAEAKAQAGAEPTA